MNETEEIIAVIWLINDQQQMHCVEAVKVQKMPHSS